MFKHKLQYYPDGSLKHLLTLEGLSLSHIHTIFDAAKKISTHQFNPSKAHLNSVVATLFYEPSTRTRTTFEIAAQKLQAHVVNLTISTSSAQKGETLRDTVQNLAAMQTNVIILRHPSSGAAHFVAEQVPHSVSVINAGDGCHAHPTQALLDMYTIQQHYKDFKQLSVAIVGDVYHSRVARSQIHALTTLGVPDIRVIAPKTLIPTELSSLGVTVYPDLTSGLKGVDVILLLRLQQERMQSGKLPIGNNYYQHYGLTKKTLEYAKPTAIVMHPGPMNRGVEIQSEIADSSRALILEQVTNGIAIRMAIIDTLIRNQAIMQGGI
jgi:aspartate carbamoyltransferase catalytic subunit